ncbi:hypothetical protein DFH09DRAFT_1367913 [Mycena vulgaris]|nr:hypothetical protein DFH09DRAFT_1367913 [Mycena vulgaris]
MKSRLNWKFVNKSCWDAASVFNLQSGGDIATAVAELNIDTERRHQEFLELLSTQSGSVFSDTESLTRASFLQHSNSSSALSLLPSSPKIFHGRDSELATVISTLLCDSARGAILGAGGMGKTTLATAALHHPTIIEKYLHRHFISCESANNGVDLVSIIGSHVGIEPSRQLAKAIIRHFTDCGPALVVLDNLETSWEPLDGRADVEAFISLLADIPSLAILITMRGAERPGKVKWTRPFLPPLEPLSSLASRQIFAEIADDPTSDEETALDELLDLSGHLPLAVSLLANVTSFEGYAGALARWKIETTSLVSDGYDKRSNLEQSIVLSLGSPRISSSPHAKDLLALLSLLPDGISDEDILTSNVPIPHIAPSASSLVRTSLAYKEATGRLKALSPIREYMQKVHPPSPSLSRPLRAHLQALLEIWNSNQQLSSRDLVPRISSHLGNISELMIHGLSEDDPSVYPDIAHGILTLNAFSTMMLKGNSPLMHKIPHLIEVTNDSRLRWSYASTCLRGKGPPITNADAENLITQGVRYFESGDRPVEQGKYFHHYQAIALTENCTAIAFFNAVSFYYDQAKDSRKLIQYNDLALSLGSNTDDVPLKLTTLNIKCGFFRRHRNHHEIIKCVHAAQRIARLTPSFPEESTWLEHEASANCALGNLPRASKLCAQAHELLVATGLEGSDFHLGIVDIQAEIYQRKTEYIQAHQMHKSVISITSPTRSPYYHANALISLAYLDILKGQEETEILRNLDAARALYTVLGSQRTLLCSAVTARLYLHTGDIQASRSLFEQCLSKSRGIYTDVVALCLTVLGDPRHGMYGQEDSLRWAVLHFSLIRKIKSFPDTIHGLRYLGDVHAAFGDDETALNLFHAALEGATEMDIHGLRAECMAGIGDIRMRRGDLAGAKEMWETAHPLFRRASQLKDVAKLDFKLTTVL